MIPIVMPQVGQDILTGVIVRWLKQEADPVAKGQVILTVESEKATFDIEAEESGILLKILHQEGDEVEILKPVGYIGQPGEEIDRQPTPRDDKTSLEQETSKAADGDQPVTNPLPDHIIATPAVKRAAREHNIDLSAIKGTGPNGRIVKRDLQDAIRGSTKDQPVTSSKSATAATRPQTVADPDLVLTFSKVRKTIARRLTHSKQSIPHFYLSVDVDVTDLLKWRQDLNADIQSHITITDLVIKATAEALTEYQRMNAHVDSERIILKRARNIGVAVAVEDGLLVPTIANADQRSLREIAQLNKKNAEAAQRGSINADGAGAFTISSLGMCSIKSYLPIINPPECAILAVGTAESRAVVVADAVAIRTIMPLTLASDHRAVDGVYAAGFLNRIKHLLENVRTASSKWTI